MSENQYQPLGGFSRDIFVSEVSDDFACNLCSEIVSFPKQCPEGHLFCNCCITSALLDCAECPVCQVPLNVNTLSKNLFVQNAVDKMTTFCVSTNGMNDRNNGDCCQWTGPLKDRQAHYDSECDFYLLKCELNGCEEVIQRRNMAEHMSACVFRNVDCVFCDSTLQFKDLYHHESVCDFRPVNCVNECGKVLACNDMTGHCATDCPLQLVDCPLAKIGLCAPSCLERLPRRDVREHVAGACVIADTVLNLSTQAVELTGTVLALSDSLDAMQMIADCDAADSGDNAEESEIVCCGCGCGCDDRVSALEGMCEAMHAQTGRSLDMLFEKSAALSERMTVIEEDTQERTESGQASTVLCETRLDAVGDQLLVHCAQMELLKEQNAQLKEESKEIREHNEQLSQQMLQQTLQISALMSTVRDLVVQNQALQSQIDSLHVLHDATAMTGRATENDTVSESEVDVAETVLSEISDVLELVTTSTPGVVDETSVSDSTSNGRTKPNSTSDVPYINIASWLKAWDELLKVKNGGWHKEEIRFVEGSEQLLREWFSTPAVGYYSCYASVVQQLGTDGKENHRIRHIAVEFPRNSVDVPRTYTVSANVQVELFLVKTSGEWCVGGWIYATTRNYKPYYCPGTFTQLDFDNGDCEINTELHDGMKRIKFDSRDDKVKVLVSIDLSHVSLS